MYYVHSLGIGTFFALCTAESCKKTCLYGHLFIDINYKICMTILNLKLLSCKSIEIKLMQKNDLRLTKKAENKKTNNYN